MSYGVKYPEISTVISVVQRSQSLFKAVKVAPWVKNLPANAGDITDTGSIPALGRSPGEQNGNPLQYSCLENPMDRAVWQAIVHVVVKESDTTY